MKAEVFDISNKKMGEIDLPEKVFSVKWNPDLVHQALVTQMANSRPTVAHARDRGDVRGGGKKPWRQKGTGRARHGSIRSPLWKGGGVTFGPDKEKVFARKINKKMKSLAVFGVLSKKIQDGELRIIDSFKAGTEKTREWGKIMKNLADLRSRNLLIAMNGNKVINRLTSNIRNVRAVSSHSLNVKDLLANKMIFLEKEAIGEIEKHFVK